MHQNDGSKNLQDVDDKNHKLDDGSKKTSGDDHKLQVHRVLTLCSVLCHALHRVVYSGTPLAGGTTGVKKVHVEELLNSSALGFALGHEDQLVPTSKLHGTLPKR